ncbi:MAG: citrate synthase [Polyangiaceae bacterium]|nr:citrate synthase [Polyangiaceae bacterium]
MVRERARGTALSTTEVLTTARAAERLGVKPQTLYAYASRGWLTRVPPGRGRASGYLRADVERLKARSDARAGHAAVAAGALQWGEPVLDTSVSSIGPEGPAYRGRSAVDLALSGVTFERVAELLWTGALPPSGLAWAPAARPSHASPAPRATPLARRILIVAALAAGPADRTLRARPLIARIAAPDGRAPAPIALSLLATLGAARRGTEVAAAIDRALVLLADHELNASTFAARVAASAGAGLCSSVLAALATVSGARHGGVCDRVEAFFREVGAPARARRIVSGHAGRGDVVPGFGHPLYPDGDPRAAPLLDAAQSIAPRDETRAAGAIVRAVEDTLGLRPTVDFALVALMRAIGARTGSAAALFAVGRCAGWVAHIEEQRAAGYLLRPRARYSASVG